MYPIKLISDIHGCDREFERMLNELEYRPQCDRLVLLGDYIDRGPNSRGVVARVMQLAQTDGAIVLGGNHEELFLNWLDAKPDSDFYLRDICGGQATIRSYCAPHGCTTSDDEARRIILEEYGDHVAFLRSLPDYHEDPDYIFVHAGINPMVSDWRTGPQKDFRWIRSVFHETEHASPKTVIFGHTPTHHLHEGDECSDIYFGHKIIGIDGGCAYGRQLNGLEITAEGDYRLHVVPSTQAAFED
ncbi:MAG TPA: metallophosphoesterase family protein [Bacilli bacterium]|nr:metallophosphoesterase family protein [Bacilli bacterium]